MVSQGDRSFYTRDGSFALDADGDLVHRGTGSRVLGWTADANGKLDTTQKIDTASKLNVPVGILKAVQRTTQADLAGNLDSGSDPATKVISGVRVFDSLGGTHDLTVEMTNHTVPPTAGAPAGAVSEWDWNAYSGPADPANLVSGSGTPGNAKLYFDSNGKQLTTLAPGALNKATLPGANGADPFEVALDFGAVSQLQAGNGVNFNRQNGFGPGSLSNIAVGSDGIITGIFTNGLNRTLGQVAVASFANPQGLDRVSDNMWFTTDNSGLPAIGAPNSADRGSIKAGYLEQSNVDISSEFTDLIVTQRGFQANTKIVTTVDQMLEELINIRR